MSEWITKFAVIDPAEVNAILPHMQEGLDLLVINENASVQFHDFKDSPPQGAVLPGVRMIGATVNANGKLPCWEYITEAIEYLKSKSK